MRTSLDLPLQRRLEERVAAHVASLRDRRVQQAGLVVLDTASGEVRAMVGSKGFWQGAGQLNIAVRRRHPGSALKPFVYALAL
ncbi:MAG: penicillin-binding protein 1C, partial [bacterium]